MIRPLSFPSLALFWVWGYTAPRVISLVFCHSEVPSNLAPAWSRVRNQRSFFLLRGAYFLDLNMRHVLNSPSPSALFFQGFSLSDFSVTRNTPPASDHALANLPQSGPGFPQIFPLRSRLAPPIFLLLSAEMISRRGVLNRATSSS